MILKTKNFSREKIEKAQWLKRVFNVDIINKNDVHLGSNTPDIVGVWWDVKDSIDWQSKKLRKAFLKSKHELAQAAYEKSLISISTDTMLRFQTAIIERRNAEPIELSSANKLLQVAAKQLVKEITSNKVLKILENNPYGIKLTIRHEVLSAIARILALANSNQV